MRRAVILCGTASFLMAFLGGILAFSLVVPTMVEAQQNRLRGESVTVAGSNGADRVELAAGVGANSHVNVLDTEGNLRAQMRTGGDGSNPANSDVRLFGPGATGLMDAAVRLGTSADLQATLQLADKNKTDRIALQVASDGAPTMAIRDEQEKDRVRLSQGPGVAAGVTVLDGAGARRITLATGGSNPATAGTVPGSSALEIRASDDEIRARIGTASGSQPDGQVELSLRDQQGNVRAWLVVSPDGTPSLQFLDADGNVTWNAP